MLVNVCYQNKISVTTDVYGQRNVSGGRTRVKRKSKKKLVKVKNNS